MWRTWFCPPKNTASTRTDRRGSSMSNHLGIHPLAQQLDALLKNRAEAGVASGFDQFPGKRVLVVGERD